MGADILDSKRGHVNKDVVKISCLTNNGGKTTNCQMTVRDLDRSPLQLIDRRAKTWFYQISMQLRREK